MQDKVLQVICFKRLQASHKRANRGLSDDITEILFHWWSSHKEGLLARPLRGVLIRGLWMRTRWRALHENALGCSLILLLLLSLSWNKRKRVRSPTRGRSCVRNAEMREKYNSGECSWNLVWRGRNNAFKNSTFAESFPWILSAFYRDLPKNILNINSFS